VDFWLKEPGKFIHHQVNEIINDKELKGLKWVDLCAGGDHGGGKFWISLKGLFWFDSKKTISEIHQVGSVSHSATDTKLLNNTVLKSIGSSLAFIVEGGRFIVQKDLTINLLVANLKLMAINLCILYLIMIFFSFIVLYFQNIITDIHIISNVASRLLIRARKH
jgi:hypothetical protein